MTHIDIVLSIAVVCLCGYIVSIWCCLDSLKTKVDAIRDRSYARLEDHREVLQRTTVRLDRIEKWASVAWEPLDTTPF